MKKKVIQGTASMAGGLTLGVAVSAAVTLIGAGICAALISAETIAAGSMGYCAMAILLIAAIAGAAAGGGKTKEKRLYVSLLVGGIYLLLLLAMTAMFFGGQYQGIGVSVLLVFSGCILPVLLGRNRKNGSKLRRSKNRRR